MNKKITGVVLAGGKSTRMGYPKALLTFRGLTLIERIISRIEPYCDEIIINANEKEKFAFLKRPLVPDKYKNCGPLGGIEAVLEAANFEYVFVTPCDLPYISGAIIPFLKSEIGKNDACVPIVNGYMEPLVALYRKTILPVVRQALAEQKFKVKEVFKQISVRYIEEELLVARDLQNIFLNVNSVSEYQELIQVNEREK